MITGNPADHTYDLALVGTGFASTFFLKKYLEAARPSAKVIVLERGSLWSHDKQIAERRNSPFDAETGYSRAGPDKKPWVYTIGFGGGTNCWWGNTPRMLPADFEMKTRFGVATDWPVGYDDLAEHYAEAERLLGIAGLAQPTLYPGQTDYPQPPHRLNQPEQILQHAHPKTMLPMPSARARVATKGRGMCCANGVCHLCPQDAKSTVQNSFMDVYNDPRVTVALASTVSSVALAAGQATGLVYRQGGNDQPLRELRADLIALGANAIFNPSILQASGFIDRRIGSRIHEQVGILAEIRLNGIASFQGSTSVTGIGYMLYDDEERRKTMAAALLETWNVGLLRTEPGKWRDVLPVRLVYEDLPDEANRVDYNSAEPEKPQITFNGHSAYAKRAIRQARADLAKIFASLPVESIWVNSHYEPTEAHIMGTVAMGRTSAEGVVDTHCVHHEIRNLLVLGGSAFPTGAPANPSLTISALSLWAAAKLTK